MPLNTIRKVSDLLPEVTGMIKQASLESNMPTSSREETLVSALELEYMIKIAHSHIDLADAERVCKAVDLYGLKDEVLSMTESMIKSASVKAAGEREIKHDVYTAVNFIDSQLLTMYPNIEKIAEASELLWDEYAEHIDSDKVKLYAGAGTLVKEAAVLALNHRASRTGNVEFTKVAEVLASTKEGSLTVEDNRSIIAAVKSLEKSANYNESDLYTDMFMTKEAAVYINLGSKMVSAESLVAVAGQVGSILGSDIGSILEDAHSNVSAIEALPMGERQVIAGLV